MRPYVNEETCICCGVCESVCPAEPTVFAMEDVAKVVSPKACTECNACVENCPVESIELK